MDIRSCAAVVNESEWRSGARVDEGEGEMQRGIGGRAQGGMTLVELLVTMTISAILLAIGVPAMRTFVINNEMATSANQLIAALNLARGEAVRLASPFGVCLAASSWTVAPLKAPPACDTATNPQLVHVGSLTDTQLRIGSTTPVASLVSFDPLGRLVTVGAATSARIIVCMNNATSIPPQSTSRAVLVASSGRVRVALTNAATGNPVNDATGADIVNCAAP
jgi:type IV fimbrial biogenesis protein FimT